MPLIQSPSRDSINQNIAEMEAQGYEHKRAVAAALGNARKNGAKIPPPKKKRGYVAAHEK